MSIGKNLMVLFNILLIGVVCFISGVCYNENPDGNWPYFLIAPLVLILPTTFEIINGIGLWDDRETIDEGKQGKAKVARRGG